MFSFWEPEFWEELDVDYPWPERPRTSLDELHLGPRQRLLISRAAELAFAGDEAEAEVYRVRAGYGGLTSSP